MVWRQSILGREQIKGQRSQGTGSLARSHIERPATAVSREQL